MLLLVFVANSNIELYNKTYFIGVNDRRGKNEIILTNKLLEEGKYDDYINDLSQKISLVDFSKEGIVCEYIKLQGNKSSDLYVVLYNDRTVRYIVGDFTGIPSIERKEFESITDRCLDINNNFFVKNVHKEETIKISKFEYVYIINNLKLLKCFDSGVKEFPEEPVADFIVGLYFNNSCYPGNRQLSENYTEQIRTMVHNVENYLEKCIFAKE